MPSPIVNEAWKCFNRSKGNRKQLTLYNPQNMGADRHMFLVLEIPLLENKTSWFLDFDFPVFCVWFYSFHGFMVFMFHGFMVSWFLGFEKYQIPISCFQEDIDPRCKIFKIWFHGSSSFPGARLFGNYQKWISEGLGFVKIIGFPKMFPYFIYFKICWYI